MIGLADLAWAREQLFDDLMKCRSRQSWVVGASKASLVLDVNARLLEVLGVLPGRGNYGWYWLPGCSCYHSLLFGLIVATTLSVSALCSIAQTPLGCCSIKYHKIKQAEESVDDASVQDSLCACGHRVVCVADGESKPNLLQHYSAVAGGRHDRCPSTSRQRPVSAHQRQCRFVMRRPARDWALDAVQ